MGQTRSLCIGLALLLSQATVASAADLGLPPPPPPEPCVGCVGPWYLKGFVGAANPDVGSIDYELIDPEFFQIVHKDLKSTPLFGLGFGYDTGHYFRFDITGEYRGRDCSSLRTDILTRTISSPPTTIRRTSKAGSGCSTPISISAPGIA